MTNNRMALVELLQKSGDLNFLRAEAGQAVPKLLFVPTDKRERVDRATPLRLATYDQSFQLRAFSWIASRSKLLMSAMKASE
jgi:hypothetical protein